MNVTEAIRKRRSIRKYQEGANIPQEDLDQILEAAMMAPSARNTRPWEFVVVENREVLNKFPDIQPYTRMMHTASLAIVVCGRPDLQQDGTGRGAGQRLSGASGCGEHPHGGGSRRRSCGRTAGKRIL